jgi:hypothetical protein
VLTYLQMFSADELIPAPPSAVRLEALEVEPSSPLIRATTLGIGRAHQWPSQHWDDQHWLLHLTSPAGSDATSRERPFPRAVSRPRWRAPA